MQRADKNALTKTYPLQAKEIPLKYFWKKINPNMLSGILGFIFCRYLNRQPYCNQN